jgi:uncharacterized cupredoxin-like copper-binding protein
VHTLAVQLAPILAAEKSKTAFFVAGGVLVAWALLLSLGLGLRNPNFPGNLGGQRVVSAITAVLVLAAVASAVITSGSPEKLGEEGALASESKAKEQTRETAKPGTSSPGESSGEPPGETKGLSKAESTKAPETSKPAPSKAGAKATTGTPAPPSSPAAATTLKLAANPAGQLAYTTKQLSAKAGKVTIDFSNSSPVEHDVAIAQGSAVVGQTPVFTGGSKTLTVTLKPGKYSFYCTVPGHRAAGMEGTLTVS